MLRPIVGTRLFFQFRQRTGLAEVEPGPDCGRLERRGRRRRCDGPLPGADNARVQRRRVHIARHPSHLSGARLLQGLGRLGPGGSGQNLACLRRLRPGSRLLSGTLLPLPAPSCFMYSIDKAMNENDMAFKSLHSMR